jgi:aminopeptidase N
LSSYVFELDTSLTIDSVYINGVIGTFTTSGGGVRSVPVTLPGGSTFTARIVYHGTPPTISGYNSGMKTYPTTGDCSGNVTFSSSEPYESREWWPCKQSLTDKIDSVDMWVTVDTALKAGSNGLLTHVTDLGSGLHRYEWKEKHPIAYYLVSVAVSNYLEYSYYMHFTGSSDTMLIQNYLIGDSACLDAWKPQLDSVGMLVDYFSQLLGRYPFSDEKYGHCMAPDGMENQTMSTVGDFDMWLVAHEMAHQWFGDNVTCGTWSDIFLNEGLANFMTYWFEYHFSGPATAQSSMAGWQSYSKTAPGGSVYRYDTAYTSVFDGRLTYAKGPAVMHMFRYLINDDDMLWNILRTYQTNFHHGNATAAGLLDVAKALAGPVASGVSLDSFFAQWIYMEGFPRYTATWNQVGDDVWVRLVQTTSAPTSVPLFTLPVEIKLRSTSGDTVVKVLNNDYDQTWHFKYDKPMSGVRIDPNGWLICNAVSPGGPVPGLGVAYAKKTLAAIRNNPTKTMWLIDGLLENETLTLTDINGKALSQQVAPASGSVEIPAHHLASGIYLLRVSGPSGSHIHKLIKD